MVFEMRVRARVANREIWKSLRMSIGNKAIFKSLLVQDRYLGQDAFHSAMERNLGLDRNGSVKVPFQIKHSIMADAPARKILDAIPTSEWEGANFAKRTDLLEFLNRFTDKQVRVIFIGKTDPVLQGVHKKEHAMRPISYYIDTALQGLQGITFLADRDNVLSHDKIFLELPSYRSL